MSKRLKVSWLVAAIVSLAYFLPNALDRESEFKIAQSELRTKQNRWQDLENEWKKSLPTVCRTKTGYAYHKCYHYQGRNYKINLYDAHKRGLSPCEKCDPPRLSEFTSFQIEKPNYFLEEPQYLQRHYIFTSLLLVLISFYFGQFLDSVVYDKLYEIIIDWRTSFILYIKGNKFQILAWVLCIIGLFVFAFLSEVNKRNRFNTNENKTVLNNNAVGQKKISKGGFASSPKSLIKDFFQYLNDEDYQGAYSLTNNDLWKPYSKFEEKVWENYTSFKVNGKVYKNYVSKYEADAILEVSLNVFDTKQDETKDLKFDFHLKRVNNNWKIVRMIYPQKNSKNSVVNTKIFNGLFEVQEFTSDTSAICKVPSEKLENFYSQNNRGIDLEVSISLIATQDISLNNRKYRFIIFHTLPAKLEGNIWSLSDCRWCNGYITIARYIQKAGSFKLDELMYDCECGKKSTWGNIEIPRFTILDDLYLILDASDYYWNNPVSLTTANICNGLALKKFISFSQGGRDEFSEVEADFKLDEVNYELRDNIPQIRTNGGKQSFYAIDNLFTEINEN